MAEPQFQIVDIPGIGQREVPATLKGADLDKFVQQIIQLESPQVTTDAEIPAFAAPNVTMPSDVPTDENLAPTPQAPERTLGSRVMEKALQVPQNILGATEALGTLGSGFLSTIGGTLAGIAKEPFTGEPAEQTAQRIQQGLTYTPRTEAGQRITQDVGSALGVFEGLPPYAPVSTRTIPTVTGVMPKGRIPKIGVPTMEELATESSRLYGIAQESGVKFKTPKFKSSMQNLAKDLRAEEGFTTTGYPKLAGAVQELTSTKLPKDFTELQALRKVIKGATKSADPQESLLGMKLLNKFDDYIINAPEKDFAVKSAEGLKAWKDARFTYSKMKKAEIFDDMIANAELGAEAVPVDRALRNSLIKLSKDENTMRFFTKTEQDRIKSLVKFEATNPKAYAQRVLSALGTISPRGTLTRVGGYGAGLGAEVSSGQIPWWTIGIGTGSKLAEIGAESLRKGGIQDLARLSRSGGYEIAPRRAALGMTLPTGSQYYGPAGILSTLFPEENQ